MKKLTIKQMSNLVDFLSDRCQDYEDDYSENAVNTTLKILDYSNEFHYDYKNDGIMCNGGIMYEEEDE